MSISKSTITLFFAMLFSYGVSGQEITVFPGSLSGMFYVDDKKLTMREMNEFLAKNDEANKYWKKSKTYTTIAGIALASELGFAIWSGARIAQDKDATGPILGTLSTAVIGIIFSTSASESRKKAILTYNKQFDKETTFQLIPMSNQYGLGLALKF